MPRYLILQDPGHNRVYFNASLGMAKAELSVLCQSRDWPAPRDRELAGIRYLQFDTPEPLSAKDRVALAQLSASYALFSTDDKLLAPEPFGDANLIEDKISSLQKYAGKTNEHFTRLMINMARYALASPVENRPLRLLDPVAGRGTTLFEALALGMHATGIELESRSVHETQVFFKKFLEQERIKHAYKRQRVAGKNKQEAVFAEQFSFAPDKKSLAQSPQTLTLIEGDTLRAAEFCKPNEFDLLVGDLPYGIAHGNKGQVHTSRNPVELVASAAPGWHRVTRTGGVLALAWNAHLISRQALAEPLQATGFRVLHHSPYDQLIHRVDNAIRRDLIVAVKQN